MAPPQKAAFGFFILKRSKACRHKMIDTGIESCETDLSNAKRIIGNRAVSLDSDEKSDFSVFKGNSSNHCLSFVTKLDEKIPICEKRNGNINPTTKKTASHQNLLKMVSFHSTFDQNELSIWKGKIIVGWKRGK